MDNNYNYASELKNFIDNKIHGTCIPKLSIKVTWLTVILLLISDIKIINITPIRPGCSSRVSPDRRDVRSGYTCGLGWLVRKHLLFGGKVGSMPRDR